MHRKLWFLAVIFFVITDLVTTMYAITYTPIIEGNPLPATAIDRYGVWILPLIKGIFTGGMYGFYRIIPDPYRIGIPIGLVSIGIPITVWKTYLLLIV